MELTRALVEELHNFLIDAIIDLDCTYTLEREDDSKNPYLYCKITTNRGEYVNSVWIYYDGNTFNFGTEDNTFNSIYFTEIEAVLVFRKLAGLINLKEV